MKKRISTFLFLVFVCGGLFVASALLTRREAVAGGGYIPGTPIGGSCTNAGTWWENVARYRYSGYSCSYAGMGWIEFKVDKNWVADGKALHYYPIKTNAGSPIDVPTECAETEYFYHYGFFNYFEGYSDSYNGTYIESTGFSNSGSPKRKAQAGARLNTYVDWINGGDYAPVDHRFYIDNVQYAHAVRAVYDSVSDPANTDTAEHKYSVAKDVLGWSDDFDEINMFCYDPDWENAKATYTGQVQVFVNDSSVTGNTYNAGTGVTSVTVKFTHTLKRESGADFETTSEWDVHPNADGTGAASHTGSFNGKVGESWNVQTTTKTVNLGQTAVTVCSSIKFDNIVSKETDGSIVRTHNGLAYKCVTIMPTPEPPSGTCPSARYSGTSKSKFTMNFNSQSYSNNYSTSNWSKTVWGKPGDNLQYIYELCGGADEPIEWGPYNEEPTLGNPHKATFTITGKSTNGLNGYLFGNDVGPGSSVSLTTASAGFSDYMRTIKSPSIDNYSCPLTSVPGKPSYYQIRANVSCGSSRVIAASDVGTTITQSLKYRYVEMEMYSVYHCSIYVCPWYTYGTKVVNGHNGANEITAEGSVKIPYNYALVPYMKHSDSDGVTYAGSSFSATAYVATLGRINKQVQTEKYATHSKNTTIRIVSFTTTGTPSQATQYVNNNNMTDAAVCSKAGGTANCKSLKTVTTILNKTASQLSGATDESRTIDNGGANVAGAISATVPLVDVGTRFCIAVGVYPVDSHNKGDNSTIDDNSQTAAFSNSGTGWKVSAPACVTVAKKPNFSTEGGDLKTNGSVQTSRSTVGGKIFGSWSEYGLVAKGEVNGMASGAAFAYTSPIYTSRSQSIAGTMVPGSRQWVCKPVHWGPFTFPDCQWVYTDAHYNGGVINMASENSGIAQGNGSECTLSTQTYGNDECNYGTVGRGTGVIGASDLDAVARKVYQKYHMSASEMQSLFKSTRGTSGLLNIAAAREINGVNVATPQKYDGSNDEFYLYRNYGSAACAYSSEFGKYIQGTPADNQRSKFTFEGVNYNNSAPNFCNAQGMKVWRAYKSSGDANVVFTNYPSNGAVYMGGAGTSDLGMTGSATTYRNPTYIFDIDGTFVIDEDMISSNGFINNEINDNYSSLDELPTVVIFAHNIILTNRVTRLDAWLIAGINGGEGVINTCGAIYEGDTLKFIHPEDSDHNNELSADICNNSVVINGFAYAKKAILNRTFGGGGDNVNKFVQRGEVFNLRADAFYWSFYQSQRNRILTTVFSRELPTRY